MEMWQKKGWYGTQMMNSCYAPEQMVRAYELNDSLCVVYTRVLQKMELQDKFILQKQKNEIHAYEGSLTSCGKFCVKKLY